MTNKISINFINKLNELCKQLDRDYYINAGGCCYVSYRIAKNLYDRNIRYTFIICDGDDLGFPKSHLALRKLIKSNAPILKESTSHYCLKIDSHYINADHYINDRWYSKYQCACINPSEILNIYNIGNWNNCFRTYNIPKVDKKIDKLFRQYYD